MKPSVALLLASPLAFLGATACGGSGGPGADEICGRCPTTDTEFGFDRKAECEQTYGECRGDGPCIDALAQSYEILCP